jgi:hypothetical protein
VVVVVLLELDEFGGVELVVVLVLVDVFVVSLVFSVVGFTIVVLFSVFLSGAGEVGATTSVFCSHAPRSAALAKMQSNFFIVWIGCPSWDNG